VIHAAQISLSRTEVLKLKSHISTIALIVKLRGMFLSLVVRDWKGKCMRDSKKQTMCGFDVCAILEFEVELCVLIFQILGAWAQKPLHRVLVKLIFDCCRGVGE